MNKIRSELPDQVAYVLQVPDDETPRFIRKLWNILGDNTYSDIVRWDESGYSFHIVDPYTFCRDVLPSYFKHSNLSSFIRQLNMYGFKKITPIDKTGLFNTESDRDHIEFSHPFFMKGHPEFLQNIKRKVSRVTESTPNTVTIQATDLSVLLNEIRQLREKEKAVDAKLSNLIKQNETAWEQLAHMRNMHMKQQHVVNKIVQFLVVLVRSSQTRLGKRNLLAIDEVGGKRARTSTPVSLGRQDNNLTEVLDRLQKVVAGESELTFFNQNINTIHNQGPIIADVTDEPDTSSNSTPSSAYRKDSAAKKIIDNKRATASSKETDPTLAQEIFLTPVIDRQLSDDLAEFFTDQTHCIDNCREFLANNWDVFNNFMDEKDHRQNQEEQEKETRPQVQQQQLMLTGADPPLALNNIPNEYNDNLLNFDPDLFLDVPISSPCSNLVTPSATPKSVNK